MRASTLSLAIAALACCCIVAVSAQAPIPAPVTQYFSSVIDHFSVPVGGGAVPTFQQKVLLSFDSWRAPTSTTPAGPVLFYTGNEGAIEDFWANTGAVFQWAAQLGALVVFAEHRYYGSSLPFGSDSFSPDNLRFLTIQQALEDYAVIIEGLKGEYNLTGSNSVPWISVGGSYGGVLSAWIRSKYPNLIAGSIAASAPINFLGPQLSTSFFAAATGDYEAQGDDCVANARAFYPAYAAAVAQGNFSGIQQALRLCDTPTPSTALHVELWTVNALLSLAQFDYPGASNFSGSSLPAFPVVAACDLLTTYPASDPIDLMAQVMDLFWNASGTGGLKCFDPAAEFIECADPTGCGLGDDATAWDWQVCTQFIYLPQLTGTSDMFFAHAMTLEDLDAYCGDKYGVTPDPYVLNRDYGGVDILQSASNIVFSNGALDPYSAGGFLPDDSRFKPNPSITLLLIENAAHHLDLRSADPSDPQSVIDAREQELAAMQQWIQEFTPARTAAAAEAEVALA